MNMVVFPEFDEPRFEGARRIGYARVSTKSQKLDMQMDALNMVNCDHIFSDHGVSGAKAKRPGLDKALREVRSGDVFVVFKLCRLGRSVLHLADLLTRFQKEGIHFCSVSEGINTTTPDGKLVYHLFSALAEFHRDLIRENTLAGLDAAKARGQKLGPKYKLVEVQILNAHQAMMQDGFTLDEMAYRYGVSRLTIKRGFERLGVG
ncbi:MAG: recombinase family protein [Phycisphaeraceae bacterium]|nr:recombinase family protein [Phycisphaeraceae bacterium]